MLTRLPSTWFKPEVLFKPKMTIYIASDHAGFELKNNLSEFVKTLGFTVIDKGPFSYDQNDDYPDYVRLVADEVLKDPNNTRGIILGKSGEGEAMVVNRRKGIRGAVYYGGSLDIIKLSREHNDANILSLGAGFLSIEDAEKAAKLWLETPFSGEECHRRRIDKIDLIE
jgi:ribose 5-phosphate isomerase B